LSSNASYSLEKWIHRKQYQPGNSQACVACETGNSVGAYSTLIPLLFFGVPITISESLIYDLMLNAGVIFQQGQFLTNNIWTITVAFLLCSLIAMLCSWPLAKFFLSMFNILNTRALYLVAIMMCVATVGVIGWNENRLLTYLISFVLLLIPGLYLKQKDTLPLIFVFIMQNSIESTISDLVNLIF
jgi:TctA family transporter